MTNHLRIGVIGFLLLLALLAVWRPTAAEPAAVYELSGTVGAGGTAVSGNYQADAIIGQTAVGQHVTGQYELSSGLWAGGIVIPGETQIQLYLPLTLR